MSDKQKTSNLLDDPILTVKEDPLLQSRLIRVGKKLDLSINDICSFYFDKDLDLNQDQDQDQDQNKNYDKNKNEIENYSIDRLDQLNSELKSKSDLKFNLDQYLLKIKHLVYLQAPWSKLKLYCWPVFRAKKTPQSAARLVEYSFLFGNLQDCLEVIDMLEIEFGSCSYYSCVHEAIRSSLILKLWQNNLDSYIDDLIEESLPIEKLYHLATMLKQKNKQEAFDYFCKNITQIISSLDNYSSSLGLKRSDFICKMARIGINIHQYKKADFILRSIPPTDPSYPEALQIITQIASLSHELVSQYLEPFFKEKNPSKRLELIDYILSLLKSGAKFKEFKNSILDTSFLKNKNQDFFIKSCTYFFINPYCLIPKTSSSNISIIKLISKYQDLYSKIPTMFHILKSMSLTQSATDVYVWEYVNKEYRSNQDKIKNYWYHLSSVKLFLLDKLDESFLFEAKSFLENITPDFNTPYDWEKIYTFICSNLKSSSFIEDKRKDKIFILLKLIGCKNNSSSLQQASYSLTSKDIKLYLDNYNFLPREYFKPLIEVAKKEKNHNLHLNLIKRKISLYELDTSDLKELWYLSSINDDRDYAWRVASCLKFKDQLDKKIESLWLISGESRSNYPIVGLNDQDFNLILSSFNKNDSEFLSCLIKLEDSLGSLLKCLSPDIISASYPQTKYKDILKESVKDKSSFYVFKNSSYNFSDSKNLTLFLNSSALNQIMFYIKAHFSLFFFLDRSEYLVQTIDKLLPKLANDTTLGIYSKEIYLWMRGLNSSKKLNFTQFSKLLKTYNTTELENLINSFLIKTSICVFQNHLELLKYLKLNRVNESIINSTINWIISDSYSKFRSYHKLESLTPISKSVKNIRF